MELDKFVEALANRIPTPEEFVSFALAQRWRFQVSGDRAALLVPDRNDPLALGFAKALSREPYRTRVLEHLNRMAEEPAAPREPSPQPEPVAAGEDCEGERCQVCQATVHNPTPEIQRMCHMVQCPYWTEESGVGPEWMAEARRAQAYQDRKRAG